MNTATQPSSSTKTKHRLMPVSKNSSKGYNPDVARALTADDFFERAHAVIHKIYQSENR